MTNGDRRPLQVGTRDIGGYRDDHVRGGATLDRQQAQGGEGRSLSKGKEQWLILR